MLPLLALMAVTTGCISLLAAVFRAPLQKFLDNRPAAKLLKEHSEVKERLDRLEKAVLID